jgi:hypothetical protein
MHLAHSLALAFAFAFTASTALAQHAHSPYVGLETRQVKSLSPEQIADLRAGRGMGASLPAELNGVPGPLHVLELRERLMVTSDQQAALEAVVTEMKTTAQQLGNDVIDAEQRLDLQFKNGSASEASIREATERIGQLNAQLRAVHLVAHLRTQQILTPRQVAAYGAARGYAAEPAAGSHPLR